MALGLKAAAFLLRNRHLAATNPNAATPTAAVHAIPSTPAKGSPAEVPLAMLSLELGGGVPPPPSSADAAGVHVLCGGSTHVTMARPGARPYHTSPELNVTCGGEGTSEHPMRGRDGNRDSQ
jgi:hypothetical protein